MEDLGVSNLYLLPHVKYRWVTLEMPGLWTYITEKKDSNDCAVLCKELKVKCGVFQRTAMNVFTQRKVQYAQRRLQSITASVLL